MLKMKKGFTLIELLVVIGVLAVLMAGVVALINPQDKIRQANDSKIMSDVGQLATALQSYAAQQANGSYPSAAQGLALLGTAGELQVVPTQPNGTAYVYTPGPAGCANTAGSPCTTALVGSPLTALRYTSVAASDTWVWCSASGRAALTADTATCPP
ncbi:hypothetical protein A2397_05955 [Candidatus Amesbacteria bacterium RIFOXYB1_FULL_44_23]|uniref:Uncharacterized protein n=1 Tax=Candidatus Amesbacteria bacterium RIFOXYB1_FULL_44_23 TaxID=1797263 RepID=A0A1F4ZRK7_9BACT|nr:MAG: hypothetical protein A2397_05955 [Candidatus Amesbacteria bacterium RIFOXYB1_FULL_44_23]